MSDLISKNEFINGKKNGERAFRDLFNEIADMPTVEQKHGQWELKRRIADVNWRSCSKCGRITDLGMGLKTLPYCQWCGAKMDEVTE